MNNSQPQASFQNQAKLEVLGCSGSLGDPMNGTSCFLLNDEVLIDAGSGLLTLSTEQVAKINHVFITHAHLDHVMALPMLVESRQHGRDDPLFVYGLNSTLEVLKLHLFNDLIWPDFSVLPSPQKPAMQFVSLQGPVEIELGGLLLKPFEVNHSAPTVGFSIRSKTGVLAISSDTYLSEEMNQSLAELGLLSHLIIESSFSNKHTELSMLTKHMCPQLLERQLQGVSNCQNVWVSYLKEWDRSETELELSEIRGEFNVGVLRQGQVLRF